MNLHTFFPPFCQIKCFKIVELEDMLCFVQGKVPTQQVHVMRELQTMQMDLNA